MRQVVVWGAVGLSLVGCASSSGTTSSGPPGSCHTGGTATGSFVAACNQCGEQQCNAELSDKSGSGWANQYFGGDGACAAFNGCVCSCLAKSGADPIQCATTTCIASLDAACQTAVKTADTCIRSKCATKCR